MPGQSTGARWRKSPNVCHYEDCDAPSLKPGSECAKCKRECEAWHAEQDAKHAEQSRLDANFFVYGPGPAVFDGDF